MCAVDPLVSGSVVAALTQAWTNKAPLTLSLGELVLTALHTGTVITSFLQMQKCGLSMFSKLLKVTSKQETRGGAQTQTVRCCLPGPGPVLGGGHHPADQGVWFDPNLHGVCLTSESPNIMEMQYSREQSSLWSLGL